MSPNEDPTAKDVWQTVCALNDAWTVHADADELRRYFHRDMVAITPTDRLRRAGRESCVAGWMGFVAQARITSWDTTDPQVQLYCGGTCAVVSYYYRLACEMGGRALDLSGRDLLTLVLEDGRWWLVADQFSGYPGEAG